MASTKRKTQARRRSVAGATGGASSASEGRLRTLFEGLADAYVRVAMDGRIEETNAAYRRMVGYDQFELAAMTYRDLTPERWHAMEQRLVEDQIQRRHYSEVYEKEYRRKDGSIFPIELRTYLILEGDRAVGMWALVRDITERKRAEEALRRSEERFRTLAREAPVGIFEADASGQNLYANRAAEAMAGLSREQSGSQNWHDALHPDDRDHVVREWSKAVASGSPCELEHRFRHQDGRVRQVRSRAIPLRNPDGRVTGYIGAMLDITDQRALESQVQSSRRLSALGTLVAGIAHEVNNPLGAMLLSLGLAVGEIQQLRSALAASALRDGERVGQSLDMLEASLTRAREDGEQVARIVKDLNVVGRPDAPHSRVSLGDVVDKAMYWLAPSLGEQVVVRVEKADVQDVIASVGQLAQVLVNLVTNAVKSIPRGRRGSVVIRVGPGAPGIARMEVADNGEGMTLEVMARMFEPFFTTRPVGQGMGLGLSVCHAIMTVHGGTISATSKVGRGSTFSIELPVAPARA
jgi:PAS domain S-box-containing protein